MTAAETFADWQATYAAHRVATFPVAINAAGDKRPLVRNYLRMGLPASAKLVRQFGEAASFGFAVGERSGITILDVDSPDERVFADAQTQFGASPLIVRSGSGNFQAWYRHNGERRSIRPDKSKPVDILGGGFVVAPPSRGSVGQYQIIAGSLDDLDRLPTMTRTASAAAESPDGWSGMGAASGRNDALFRRLGIEVRHCDDLDQLLDRAKTLNAQFAVPMDEARVVSTARSVWRMEREGRNRFGQIGAFMPVAETDQLIGNPDAFALLGWLRAHERPQGKIMIANGLAKRFGWSRERLAKARSALLSGGWVLRVSRPAPGLAAGYVWGRAEQQPTSLEGMCLKSSTVAKLAKQPSRCAIASTDDVARSRWPKLATVSGREVA